MIDLSSGMKTGDAADAADDSLPLKTAPTPEMRDQRLADEAESSAQNGEDVIQNGSQDDDIDDDDIDDIMEIDEDDLELEVLSPVPPSGACSDVPKQLEELDFEESFSPPPPPMESVPKMPPPLHPDNSASGIGAADPLETLSDQDFEESLSPLPPPPVPKLPQPIRKAREKPGSAAGGRQNVPPALVPPPKSPLKPENFLNSKPLAEEVEACLSGECTKTVGSGTSPAEEWLSHGLLGYAPFGVRIQETVLDDGSVFTPIPQKPL